MRRPNRNRPAPAARTTRRRGRNGLISSARRRRPRTRRGVTSVLAMMFMVLFGSLAAAMAVSSQGNLRTAHTHIVVTRALGAADTGLSIAAGRLQDAARTVRVTRGEITPAYAMQLWDGSFSPSDGDVLLPDGSTPAGGLSDVLWDLHAADNYPAAQIAQLQAPGGNPSAWLDTLPFAVQTNDAGMVSQAAQVTYVPVPALGAVRAVVTGYAWDAVMNRWISRTVQQDFRLFKRVDQAILAPSKVMLGKNVLVNGPLAAMFNQVDNNGGHPLVARSDFAGLDDDLDRKLQDFYDAVRGDGYAGFDANGDNRLAAASALESRGLSALNQNDYDGDANPDSAFAEVSGDGYIDEFDIFLEHFDDDGDHNLVYSADLADGTSYAGLTEDFAGIDDDLAFLIDTANPDRNRDGVVDAADRALGYLDGVVNYRDQYAKVRGTVYFDVQQSTWNDDGHNVDGSTVNDYRRQVAGAIRPDQGDDPVVFGASDQDVAAVDPSTFDTAQSELASRADGGYLHTQLGLPYIAQSAVNGDGVVVGQNFNPSLETVFEGVPFGAIAPADYYRRPVIQGETFHNVVIPMGTNALFIDCTFAGVTRVESYQANNHPAWQFYGVQEPDGSLKYPAPPPTPDIVLDNDYLVPGENTAPTEDFNVPRLNVGGTPYVNTKPRSNNLRFHDCKFIGSIVADKPSVFTHTRNKLQFTGATQFHERHPDNPDDPSLNPNDDDLAEIRKSSMLLPSYSVDIGTNNASPNQNVNLQGLIIAGVLDVRGNAVIDGALMTDFLPTPDNPALQHFGETVGNPAHFNMTLGYFSADDGDEEGMPIFEHNGVDIVGFDLNGDGIADTADPDSGGTPVPFNGFGRITVNWNPNLIMPDGLLAPMQTEKIDGSYHEGKVISLPN